MTSPAQTPKFLSALQGEAHANPPVWFMRQAGRSLPEYRAVRGEGSILQAIRKPDVATELTLQPVRRYGVDAAVRLAPYATLDLRVAQDIFAGRMSLFLGVDNLLVTPRGAAIAEAARALGVPVRELPMRGDLDIAFVWRLRQLLRQEQPDLLHLHSRRGADLWGGLAGRWAGVPVVLSRRVDNPEPRWWVACRAYRACCPGRRGPPRSAT
mgnify:CR=1 FL=1